MAAGHRWLPLRILVAMVLAVLTLPVAGTASAEEADPAVTPETSLTTTEEAAPPAEETPPVEEPAAEEAPPAEEAPAEQPAPEAPAAEEPASAQPAKQQPATQKAPSLQSIEPLVEAQVAPTGTPGVCDTNERTGTVASFTQNTREDSGGDWIGSVLNPNNSDYAEGDFVPQRVQFTGLQPGEQEFVFTYDVTKNGIYAYDFVAHQRLVDGDGSSITSWEVVNGDGPVATVNVTFFIPEGTDGTATLYFDMHIATELDWGADMGAGTIDGAPYHVALQSLNCASVGAMDNQLMASAVDAGEITVTKVADPADGTDFSFTIAGEDSVTFGLDVDGDATLPDTVTYRVAPGSWSVTENALPEGWNLTSLVCTGTTPTYDGATATFPVADDDAITCTFTDTKQTYDDLTVTKTADPSYDRDYDWTITKQVVGEDSQNVPEGDDATFEYDVVVTPSAPMDSNFAVTGEITVTNPNDVPIEGVTIADTTSGTTCEITGVTGPVTLQPGDTSYDYTCTFADATAQTSGTNTVDLTWSTDAYYGSTGEATGTAGYDFGAVTPTTTDDTVTVTDSEIDLGDPEVVPEGNVVTATDGETTFTYPLTWPGEPGTCTDYDNTATLTETDGGTQQATETVEVCVGSDLDVAKTVVESLTRTYDWDVTKTADDATLEVDPATGKVTATYDVEVSAGAYEDSGWLMSGTITVENPNDWQDITLTGITDVYDGGGTCTVDTTDGLIITAGDSRVFDYTCAFGSQPIYDGTNTATITWNAAAAFTPTGTDSGTAAVTAGDWDQSLVNEEVTLVDDMATPADDSDDVTLGTYTWSENFATTVEHSIVLEGEAGSCVDYTNTASVVGDGDVVLDSDDADVAVCWPVDLTVTKTADATYDRTYLWDLTKVADDPTTVEVAEDGTATFDYTVEAVPNGYTDDGHTLAGTITVTNPNDYMGVTVDITDAVDIDGVTCQVTGGTGVEVPADDEVTVGYTCDVTGLTEADYTGGTNTATATWADGTASGTADVEFDLDDETDRSVEVFDNRTDLFALPGDSLGTAEWNAEGTPTPFTYQLELGGEPGECTGYTNTARLFGDAETALDTARETVTVCEEEPLSVTKTADATFDRTYLWDFDKAVAEPTTVEVAEGETHEFDYTVTATPNGYSDSGWAMEGTITVTNPNGYDAGAITADITDSTDVGAVCTVPGGEDLVVDPGESVDLSYTCTFTEEPDYEGRNTATATWLDPEGTERSRTGTADVDFELTGETDETVDVYDDKVDLAEPEKLGTATWNSEGYPTEFPYSLSQEGVAGECTDYTNTAFIEETGQEDSTTVTLCVEDALDVSKTVDATYDRTYLWQIDKEVGEDRLEVLQGDPVFSYTVSATPDGFTDDGWVMEGTITVTNPNTYDDGDITATVTDLTDVGGGAQCTVDNGTEVTVAAGGEPVVLAYTCTFTGEPAYDGTNTATAAWTAPDGETERSAAGTADVDFALDGETNKTINVYDDKTDPDGDPVDLGQATWNADGTPTVFTYELALPGSPGTCVDYTNTAWIEQTGQDDEVTVVVCKYGEVVVTKTAEATYDRVYAWDIDKRVDRTSLTTGADGTATAGYTVEVSPAGFTDSGWEMTGVVTVHNPNDWADLTIGLEDLPNLGEGVTCEFDEGLEDVVERGATTTYTYACTFEEQPEYVGDNTVVVDWHNADGQGEMTRNGTATTTTPVAFEIDEETDKVVTVVDEMAEPDLLGEVTWAEGGESTLFEYSVELSAAPGVCETVVNTATIVETGQDAQATVTVCGDEILPVERVVSRPPVAPAEIAGVQGGLPDTGAPAGSGLITMVAGLSVLLGSWLLLRTRRTTAPGRSPQ